MSDLVEGVGGNREVPPQVFRGGRTDLGGTPAAACPEEEGGSSGKHGFPHATEPEVREKAA
jgi:hypothetical protein